MEVKISTIDLLISAFKILRKSLESIFLETQELNEDYELNAKRLREFSVLLFRQLLNVKLLLKELTILANFLELSSKNFALTYSRNALLLLKMF